MKCVILGTFTAMFSLFKILDQCGFYAGIFNRLCWPITDETFRQRVNLLTRCRFNNLLSAESKFSPKVVVVVAKTTFAIFTKVFFFAFSSRAHARIKGLELDDLNYEQRPYNGGAAYGESKLANVLFSRELGKRFLKSV